VTTRRAAKPKGFRRFERWLVGLAFAIIAFVLEKVVMRSVRRKGEATPAEEITTVVSKGGEVDVDL
jgi:hypothetical protein